MTDNSSTGVASLPCPFCGHCGLCFTEGSTFQWLAYSCGGCGMGSETRVQTLGQGDAAEWRLQAERDAINEWNQRAAPPQRQPLTDEQIDAGIEAWFKTGITTNDGKDRGHPFRERMRAAIDAAMFTPPPEAS